MKISAKLEELINLQIQLEFESRYAYLAMSAWFETTPFQGFAFWMRSQASEENFHGMKFFDYLVDRFGTVKLMPIGEPTLTFGSPLDAFRASLAHEQKVTKSINDLYTAATDEKDYATLEFLNWFLKEQVEEEKSVQDVIDELELAGTDPDALLRLDKKARDERTEGEC
ncbi:MAG: ferritin [Verrucomicrobiota bacterium]